MTSKLGSLAFDRRLRSKARRLSLSLAALLVGLGVAPDALAGTGSLNPDTQELDLTVLFRYLPPQQDLDALQETLDGVSAVLCDVTEGQLRLGTVKVRANSCEGMGCQTGFDEADVVFTWTNTEGAAQSNVCAGQGQPCTELGSTGSNSTLSRFYLSRPVALAHELAHYVLNLADSYEQYQCKDYRPPYGSIFTCDAIESGNGTVTSLMMADACGAEDDDIYTELTTDGTLPDLGQNACAVAVDCDADTMCPALGGYDAQYDGFKNDTDETSSVCNAFDPQTCRFEWPATYWWSKYKFEDVLSEMDQAAQTLQAANGGVPFFSTVATGVPESGVPASRAAFCAVPPLIYFEIEAPDQVMLVLDRSWSMAFPDSDFEKCDPVMGCPEICGNAKDDDGDGMTDELGCEKPRLDTLKSFSLAYLDLLAAAEEQIETGVLSFACDNDTEVPLTVPTTANIGSTYAPAINTLVANGNTGIVDALRAADSQLDGASKAIFLVTDGFNTCGDDDVVGAIQDLEDSGTRVFALSFGPGFASSQAAEIAGGTHGRYLGVERTNDLGPAFARQWANFVVAGQVIPQLPYRLNRLATHTASIKTPETWLNADPPPGVPPPNMERFDVWAEKGTSKLMILLASDHEDLSGFGLRAKLLGPAGLHPSSFDTTVPSPLLKVTRRTGYMLLELKAPNPGAWQIQLTVPALAAVKPQQTGYITVLNRSPQARLSTDISRTVVDDPTGGVVVKAYPRWDSGSVFGATVEANLVGPTGLVTALEVQGGDEPTEGYRALVPAWAITLEGLYEVRLRVVGLHGTASLSNGEWLPPVAMPVDFVRTASESFVVTPNHCGPSSCLQ